MRFFSRRDFGSVVLGATVAPGIGLATTQRAPEWLQDWLTVAVRSAGIPGVTAAIDGPAGLRTAAAGRSDLSTQCPMQPWDRMLSGSTGKTFVGAAGLAVAMEGRLDLDGSIEPWVGGEPWWPRVPSGPLLTLRMLLTHSSGLADHVKLDAFAKAVVARRASRGADATFTPAELIEIGCAAPALFVPGEGFAYSDTGYILAGVVIERASGQAPQDFIRDRFLEPLDLSLTSASDRRLLPGLVHGYIDADNPFTFPPDVIGDDGRLAFNPSMEGAGGGLVTNAGDLARWARALYGGRALDGSYLPDLLNGVATGGDDGSLYGLGVRIWPRRGAPAILGHGGWIPGYSSALRYDPRTDVAVAVQINTVAETLPGRPRGPGAPNAMELAVGLAAAMAEQPRLS